MSWNGFLPGRKCKRCGKELQGEGSSYPAESYAGTYNGLCYPCTRESAYLKETSELDGAEWWSHPPHCPSHRRDRNLFIRYPDCQKCKEGNGIERWEYSLMGGGRYPVQCDVCMNRGQTHPGRLQKNDRRMKLMKAAGAAYKADLIKHRCAKYEGKGKKRKLILLPEREHRRKRLVQYWLARWERAKKRLYEICEKRKID